MYIKRRIGIIIFIALIFFLFLNVSFASNGSERLVINSRDDCYTWLSYQEFNGKFVDVVQGFAHDKYNNKSFIKVNVIPHFQRMYKIKSVKITYKNKNTIINQTYEGNKKNKVNINSLNISEFSDVSIFVSYYSKEKIKNESIFLIDGQKFEKEYYHTKKAKIIINSMVVKTYDYKTFYYPLFKITTKNKNHKIKNITFKYTKNVYKTFNGHQKSILIKDIPITKYLTPKSIKINYH